MIERLADAIADPLHEFWSDDVSLLDGGAFDASRIHGLRQVTDL